MDEEAYNQGLHKHPSPKNGPEVDISVFRIDLIQEAHKCPEAKHCHNGQHNEKSPQIVFCFGVGSVNGDEEEEEGEGKGGQVLVLG